MHPGVDRRDRRYVEAAGPFADSPFSQAVRVDQMIFVSGQLGINENGALVDGGVGSETQRALQSLAGHLDALGASLADVVKTTVFLTDFDDYATFNETYRRFFPDRFPVRSTIGVSKLALAACVEIEAVAIVSA